MSKINARKPLLEYESNNGRIPMFHHPWTNDNILQSGVTATPAQSLADDWFAVDFFLSVCTPGIRRWKKRCRREVHLPAICCHRICLLICATVPWSLLQPRSFHKIVNSCQHNRIMLWSKVALASDSCRGQRHPEYAGRHVGTTVGWIQRAWTLRLLS